MLLVRVDWDRKRVWVCGRRLHHYLSGILCMAVGAWLVWDDRRDLPLIHPAVIAPVFNPEVGWTTTTEDDW